ncbi:glycosyltransferase family 1 protein [Croceicoccus sp. YJ47]|uniref:glycosyltransferase family 4 protein n=1 Tax=Croceicoccus sp. YJ47 TaxID=2798724 RepID=UPI0019229137|nr:glycosyltransferase family 1 protein [Croceicoccus sp. YJ47]QQN74839.1 glycosyltransferase family 1 protein [Croceicoccus sp. YJ47]
MRICMVSDAWHPQVNGVVRSLQTTCDHLRRRGHAVTVIGPDAFRSVPCPSYPEIRLAIAGERSVGARIADFAPDMLHLSTEGPLGHAARRWALRRGFAFTTAYHTQFPDYLAQRTGLPAAAFWGFVRRFHAPSHATMAATQSLSRDLTRRGIGPVVRWGRGVDLEQFGPDGPRDPVIMAAPGPRLLYTGRVAVEKNLEAFLRCVHPGTKFIVGDGPARAALQRRYPDVHFLGTKRGEALAAAYRAADCFVFPSLTDTFGLVMIEALACGVPVAAFDVAGPRDVLCDTVAAMGGDLDAAIAAALGRDRAACVRHARRFTWDAATDQFENALVPMRAGMRQERRAGQSA